MIATSSAAIASASRHAASARCVAGRLADGATDAIERPAQIDGGGPRRVEERVRVCERGVGGIAIERERQAVGADGADQRGAAHPHLADRERRRIGVGDLRRDDAMGQRALVDRLDVAGAVRPDERTVARGIEAAGRLR